MSMLINEKYLLSSVTNAMKILRVYTKESKIELSLTEISEKVGINKSSTHRLLTTLTKEGFLEKNKRTKCYRLGLALLTLSGVIITHKEVHRQALPIIKKLAEEIGEATHLGIVEGGDIVYLHKEECKHPVRLLSHIGTRNPTFCTGIGKAILAFQSEKEINKIISLGLVPYTPKTIIDPEEFKQDLERIKKQGYSICIDQLHEGAISIAAPIWDYSNHVIAAVSIVGPTLRITEQKIPLFISKVIQAADSISQGMGYLRITKFGDK